MVNMNNNANYLVMILLFLALLVASGNAADDKNKVLPVENESGQNIEKQVQISKKHQEPTSEEIAAELFEKLKKNQFDEVEVYFDTIITSREKNKNGEDKSFSIYGKLASHAEGSGKEIIDNWCDSSSHYAAFVTRARYLVKEGWKVRGGSFARHVSKEQSEVFREKLIRGLNDLEKAYEINQNDPNISTGMVGITMALSLGDDILELWFKRGVETDPSFHMLYRSKLKSLMPKWGGDWEDAYNFAYFMYENPPPGSLAYILMLSLFKEIQYRNFVIPGGGKIDYDTIMKYADNIEQRYKADLPDGDFVTIPVERIRGGIYYLNYNNDRKKNVYNDIEKAEKSFRRIVEKDPEYAWAWYMLGQLYNKDLNKAKESIEYFNKAIELSKNEGWYYGERGQAALEAKLYQLCIDDLSFAIEHGYSTQVILNKRSHCYLERAEFYRGNEKYDSALEDYTKILERNPRRAWVLQRRASLYYSEYGNLDKAIKDVEQILEIQPNHGWALATLRNYEKEMKDK